VLFRSQSVDGAEELDAVTKMMQGYMDRVQRVMMHNPRVAEAFFHVMHMVSGPEILFRPDIVAQVLIGSWRQRQPKRSAALPVAHVETATGIGD